MFLTSLYFSNADTKPFLLYLEVNLFSTTFLWLAIARHILFLLKLFYSPGRTGGFVFAKETIKYGVDFHRHHIEKVSILLAPFKVQCNNNAQAKN